MKVILKETIDSLGIIGTEVRVADGYARNYLLPQNKAVVSTLQNRKMLEQESAKFELQIAKERKLAEEMAQRLEGVVCTIAAKVSEEDRLYGSISVRDIVDTLASQNIVVEKRMVLLKEPIKAIGCGTLEWWVSKEIIHFKLQHQDEFCHLPNIAVSQTHFSNIPTFQRSIWGKAPNF